MIGNDECAEIGTLCKALIPLKTTGASMSGSLPGKAAEPTPMPTCQAIQRGHGKGLK
jgi:hypothetical protein